MRIAFISAMTGPRWGGSEELWASAAHAAVADGHAVAASVARPPGPGLPPQLERMRAAGIDLHTRPLSGRLQRAPPLYRAYAAVARPYRRLLAARPEVVCFSMGMTLDCAQFADANDLPGQLRARGVPYVAISQQNDDYAGAPVDAIRSRAADFLGGAHRACFVSARNLHAARRQLAHPLPNGLVLRNPVNLADRSVVPWPADDGPAGGPALFGCVARLWTGQKGQDLLFEVLASPPWRTRDWRLRLYGEGLHLEYLRALARQDGIADRVDFRGQVADIRAAWAENHLAILPSRSEGTALAQVEAMLCGRAVVVTDVGGATEWLADDVGGLVAEAATVPLLARAMERAWQARDRWEQMGRDAHEAAAARFDPAAGRTLLNLVIEASRAAGASAAPGRADV